MLVFIDESGDAGLKLDAGSTEYFVVTLLIFQDHDEAQDADERINLLRSELSLSPRYEFHFNKLNRRFKEKFFRVVSAFNFGYFGIVINKRGLTGPGFQYKESFYKYTCSLVFENAKPHLNEAIVVIDGSGSKEFKKQLANYLKKKVNDKNSEIRCIKKVKVEDSKRNNLLQMADMVCGAVARSYKDKTDAQLYRDLIRHRESRVQFWPKE